MSIFKDDRGLVAKDTNRK